MCDGPTTRPHNLSACKVRKLNVIVSLCAVACTLHNVINCMCTLVIDTQHITNTHVFHTRLSVSGLFPTSFKPPRRDEKEMGRGGGLNDGREGNCPGPVPFSPYIIYKYVIRQKNTRLARKLTRCKCLCPGRGITCTGDGSTHSKPSHEY